MKARRVRHNPWAVAASCIPWALIPVFAIASLITKFPFAAFTPHLLIVGALVFTNVWRRKVWARFDPVHVATDASSLLIDDERIPRDLVKRAELVPWTNRTLVRVALRGRIDEEIVCDDEESAHALLKQLGFDPSQTTATYRLASLGLARYRWAPLVLVPIAMLIAMASKVGPFFPLALAAMLPIYFLPASVTVGVDGLLVKWLWVREFIPTKDIITVQRFERRFGKNRLRGVALSLPGRTVELPIYADEMIVTIEQRIRDVIALAKGTVHVEDEALVLARGELGVRDWIVKLKTLGAGATATLRTAAVMPEQLWRVAEDPAQPAIKRAAAAIALAPSLAEPDKERLGELAKTTAAPKLRIALERVAEDAPDEELEEALCRLEE